MIWKSCLAFPAAVDGQTVHADQELSWMENMTLVSDAARYLEEFSREMFSLRLGRNRDQTEVNRSAGRNRRLKDPRKPSGRSNGIIYKLLYSLDDS